jgi:choline dehydrogenase-like flavoprotein
MLQVVRSPKVYDVCVIGSGAAGGVAAKVLTHGGLEVVLLEAGRQVDPATDFKQHLWPYELARRGIGVGGEGDDLMAANGFWSIKGEPYIRAPGTRFQWFRSRIVGGRTNHWGQGAYRFSEADFKQRSDTGVGEDWPISYEDMIAYYRKVESYIGVYGTDTNSMPIPRPRCTELLVKRACDRLGIPCVTAPGSILTRPLNGRPACHYCGQCWRGCKTGSNFSSSQVLIPAASTTGRLTLLANAMAREILVDANGVAKAVSYVDKTTRTEQQVRAKVVVLAASACESARLLLNSQSSLFPNGLANSSGVVGRYLRDSIGTQGVGYFPQLEKTLPHNHDGIGRPHLWIPRGNKSTRGTFLGNYHILFLGGRNMPLVSDFDPIVEQSQGYGLSLKRTCKRMYGSLMNFIADGEMTSNDQSYCEIDRNITDEWGIPVLRFHFQWGANEIAMAKDMQETIQHLVEAGGGTYLTRFQTAGDLPYGISPGGMSFHEQGTVRMGTNPRASALNDFCQAHDVRNLFVLDAACFVSSSDKPPTHTILALAWRASEYLVEEARKGNL